MGKSSFVVRHTTTVQINIIKKKQWEKGKKELLVVLTRASVSDPLYFSSFDYFSKPSGLRAGRKLRNHRRNERWSSKEYNKAHSVSHMKANPLGGSCMSKGIVVEKM
jgi:hypothetical protein